MSIIVRHIIGTTHLSVEKTGRLASKIAVQYLNNNIYWTDVYQKDLS